MLLELEYDGDVVMYSCYCVKINGLWLEPLVFGGGEGGEGG